MRARADITLRFADVAMARAVAESAGAGSRDSGSTRKIRGRAVHLRTEGTSLAEVRDQVDSFLGAASRIERDAKPAVRRRK